jgi:hypothetical protein
MQINEDDIVEGESTGRQRNGEAEEENERV